MTCIPCAYSLPRNRCLLACFKYLGRCACPDCLIEKENFWKMGTKTDMARRVSCVRVDNEHTQFWQNKVREFIFNLGKGPESQAVRDTVLHQLCLTPTRVSLLDCSPSIPVLMRWQPERVFHTLCRSRSQSLETLRPRCHARI